MCIHLVSSDIPLITSMITDGRATRMPSCSTFIAPAWIFQNRSSHSRVAGPPGWRLISTRQLLHMHDLQDQILEDLAGMHRLQASAWPVPSRDQQVEPETAVQLGSCCMCAHACILGTGYKSKVRQICESVRITLAEGNKFATLVCQDLATIQQTTAAEHGFRERKGHHSAFSWT